MRTRYLGALVAVLLLAVAGSAAAAPILLTEHFDNIATLPGAGWVQNNTSVPVGTTGWFQGNPGVFTAFDGAADAYIAANYLNTNAAGGAVSNWLLTPEVALAGGSTLTFDARSAGGLEGDRLEIRYSTNGASVSLGDFTSNPLTIIWAGTGDLGWIGWVVTLPSMPAADGRFAFRYVVPDTTIEGDYIGIDNVRYERVGVSPDPAVPEPATLGLVGLGLVALGLRRRRR